MTEEKTAKIVFANGKEYPLTDKKAKAFASEDMFGKTKKVKKAKLPTLNGKALDTTQEMTVEKVENDVLWSQEGHKTSKFPLDCVNIGCELASKEQWQIKPNGEINKHPVTGTHFVGVVREGRTSESPLGENLIKAYLESELSNE